MNLNLDYYGTYESNIFHSFADSNVTGAMLNVLGADATWRYRPSYRFRHKLTAYFDLDYYPAHTQRNRSAVGVRWEPTVRYARHGRFFGTVDFSRRNRDLIDDSGNLQARTFKKWVFDFELTHRYDFNHLRLEQTIGFVDYNYDEIVDTLTGQPKPSYDYSGVIASFLARYDFDKHWRAIVLFASDKRDYDERRTYTITFGATVGRPFEIRNFRQNSIEFGLEHRFTRKHRVWASFEYADRNENFENFYGYIYRQLRFGSSLQLTDRLRSLVTMRFKNKDYDNYWTRRIGINNRVSIDYTDIKLEGQYALSQLVDLTFFVRSYNKVSNDPVSDYTDVTAGTGIKLKY
ncbi:MAG: hypothetical protein D6800_13290 [Candidatus Zixiibacteriota bacterium]|nr:MAG: hypothetical protein D6800_13290 [candidate division Zixibacteria bacterium]